MRFTQCTVLFYILRYIYKNTHTHIFCVIYTSTYTHTYICHPAVPALTGMKSLHPLSLFPFCQRYIINAISFNLHCTLIIFSCFVLLTKRGTCELVSYQRTSPMTRRGPYGKSLFAAHPIQSPTMWKQRSGLYFHGYIYIYIYIYE